MKRSTTNGKKHRWRSEQETEAMVALAARWSYVRDGGTDLCRPVYPITLRDALADLFP